MYQARDCYKHYPETIFKDKYMLCKKLYLNALHDLTVKTIQNRLVGSKNISKIHWDIVNDRCNRKSFTSFNKLEI